MWRTVRRRSKMRRIEALLFTAALFFWLSGVAVAAPPWDAGEISTGAESAAGEKKGPVMTAEQAEKAPPEVSSNAKTPPAAAQTARQTLPAAPLGGPGGKEGSFPGKEDPSDLPPDGRGQSSAPGENAGEVEKPEAAPPSSGESRQTDAAPTAKAPQGGAPPAEASRREEAPPVAAKSERPPSPAPREEKPAGKRKDSKPGSAKEEDSLPDAEKAPEKEPFLPRKEVGKLIATAKKYMGTPYRFGGTTPKGFDCSGFVQFVFRRHGFAIPRAADEQYRLGVRVKKRQELEPGDLVFFSTYEKGASHCGIYLGDDQFIHVSSRRGVRVDSLDDEYWKPRWYGGKHIVK